MAFRLLGRGGSASPGCGLIRGGGWLLSRRRLFRRGVLIGGGRSSRRIRFGHGSRCRGGCIRFGSRCGACIGCHRSIVLGDRRRRHVRSGRSRSLCAEAAPLIEPFKIEFALVCDVLRNELVSPE